MNEWRQLIHERQQSGQSVRAWCLQNGIRENSYYYWLRIIREEA
ncbi:MAG: IS66 family insertion sequence element accessory protein TnpA, partial [Faecousia sp.]